MPKLLITALMMILPLMTFFSQADESIKKIEVVYPDATPDSYFVKLLALALSYSEQKYVLKKLGEPLPHDRPFVFLQQNKFIDVAWGGARIEREKHNLAIRFPIFKGLNGWRVPIVHNDNKNMFADIDNAEALKKFSVNLHSRWSDAKIFKHHNYPLVPGTSLKDIYNKLAQKHADYLPQSVLAAQHELKVNPHLPLTIAPDILIQYPSAYYFYVHKNNHELAQDIKMGLESALKDGQFDRMFNAIYASSLKQLNLKSRHIIKLSNPLLSEQTPLNNSALWAKVSDY